MSNATNAGGGEDDTVQKDIERGNVYRLEGLKYTITIAGALLAFTVTFRPTLKAVEYEWLIFVSWIALGVSVLCGIVVMMCWERFYLSYRDGRGVRVKEKRARITERRRYALAAQLITLAIGVIGVAWFAASNLKNAVADEHAPSQTAPSEQ